MNILKTLKFFSLLLVLLILLIVIYYSTHRKHFENEYFSLPRNQLVADYRGARRNHVRAKRNYKRKLDAFRKTAMVNHYTRDDIRKKLNNLDDIEKNLEKTKGYIKQQVQVKDKLLYGDDDENGLNDASKFI